MALYLQTATEAARKVRKGEVTVEEIVCAHLARIEETDAEIRAWAFLDPEGAISQARALDRKRAEASDLDLLWGAPVGVKDVINVEGMPMELGSPIWRGYRPGNDARVVANLRMAHAVVLGKTTTAEFAVHYNDTTRNPHDLSRSPGTSSCGSAAAVALAQVPVALGTQTAASIIRPASFCGIYGFKPSFGLIPRTGILKTLDTLDHVGILARSIEDVRLFFEAIRVRGPNYPISDAALGDDVRQTKPAERPWRVAVLRCPAYENAPDHARAALDELARTLAGRRGEGGRCYEVRSFPFPDFLRDVHHLHAVVYEKSLSYYFREEVEKHPGLVSPVFHEMCERGRRISMDAYRSAVAAQDEKERLLDAFFAGTDVILTLATAGEAPVGLQTPEKPDSGLVWTFCRTPSLSAPAFWTPSGLPFGLQIVARRYNDLLLLRFAEDVVQEGLIPYHSKVARPADHAGREVTH